MEKSEKNILEKAAEIIYGVKTRAVEYGEFDESMERATKFANLLINDSAKTLETKDFYKCLIALKISRLAYNIKEDTIIDAINYLAGLHDYSVNKANLPF